MAMSASGPHRPRSRGGGRRAFGQVIFGEQAKGRQRVLPSRSALRRTSRSLRGSTSSRPGFRAAASISSTWNRSRSIRCSRSRSSRARSAMRWRITRQSRTSVRQRVSLGLDPRQSDRADCAAPTVLRMARWSDCPWISTSSDANLDEHAAVVSRPLMRAVDRPPARISRARIRVSSVVDIDPEFDSSEPASRFCKLDRPARSSFHPGKPCTGPDQVRTDPCAEDGAQGIEQDRLAGPGFAREHVQPVRELGWPFAR